MLTNLVEDSDECSQEVTFSCRNAMFKLSEYTWFSSPSVEKVLNFGVEENAKCPCGGMFLIFSFFILLYPLIIQSKRDKTVNGWNK